MNPTSRSSKPNPALELDLFCSPVGEAWRVYVRAPSLPGYLSRCFDRHGEACPVYLDLDDLDYQMLSSGVVYEKVPSCSGGVQLLAKGRAATVLAAWLAQCFASGERSAGELAQREASEGF